MTMPNSQKLEVGMAVCRATEATLSLVSFATIYGIPTQSTDSALQKAQSTYLWVIYELAYMLLGAKYAILLLFLGIMFKELLESLSVSHERLHCHLTIS